MNQRLVEVKERLALLLAPQREAEQLRAEVAQLEAEQVALTQAEKEAARQAALHSASLKKHADLAVGQQKLRDVLPFLTQAKQSVDGEGRLQLAYWPGESEAVNKANRLVAEAIELLAPQNYAQY